MQLPNTPVVWLPLNTSRTQTKQKRKKMSSSSSSSKKKIILKSSDGETFEVDEAVAIQSEVIRQRIENDCADGVFPLANVTSGVLSKVIEYCEKHAESAAPDSDDRAAVDQLKNFDAQFVKVDQAILFDLILAANYLDIKGLLDLTCQTIAVMIRGKNPEEIRKQLNIPEFIPEEDEEIRRERHAWAFE